MGPMVSFVLGIVAGLVVAWWFFERRDAESRESIEAGWKKKLEHVEAEVKRADAAHDETKEKLRQLQQAQLPAPEPAAKAPDAEPAPPDRPSTTDEPSTAGKPSTTGKPSPAAEQPLSDAERIAQAKRRIDAKLAQLPAGSSARKRLLAERAALETPAKQPTPDQPLFTAPAAAPDDLERIRGIGPVLRQRLNKLGVTTFAQIADFTEDDLTRLDDVLDFRGRIARENWVDQAKALRDQA